MDIERIKKLLNSGIEAGNKLKAVREVVKNYKTQKQDMYDETEEIFKPSIEVQKQVKKTIDEKQDEIIEQLKKNQEKIVKAIEFKPKKAISWNGEKLPALDWDYEEDEGEGEVEDEDEGEVEDEGEGEGEVEDEDEDEGEVEVEDEDEGKVEDVKPSTSKSKKEFNIDKDITPEYEKFLKVKELPKPSEILNKSLDVEDIIKKVKPKIKQNNKYILEHSTKKGKPLKKLKPSQLTVFKRNSAELEYFKDYLVRLEHIKAAPKYMGEGIYTHKKRNAYKISQRGQYGGLVIDLPKLYGHLKVIAHKNGEKVYDKQADFDTLDLLTKRFNNKKNYSELARSIFNDLNRLSQIPIHRTSKKYSKLGSGVVYYNNPVDLLSRLELLGGSMSAGNNSNDIREEFAKIVHILNKLNVIDNKQVNDLLKEYLI